MSDIFLSYATQDRATAQSLAEALRQLGWSVWWDRQIPPGKTFDQVIEDQLSAARCVIVLWSRNSVSSRWVKTEASEGAERAILVPALIENVAIPLEFKRIQAAQLMDWRGNKPHPEFTRLVQAVESVLKEPGRATSIESPPPPSPPSALPPWLLPVLVAIGGLSILALVNALGVDFVHTEQGGSAATAFVVILWLVGGPCVLYLAWRLWRRKQSERR